MRYFSRTPERPTKCQLTERCLLVFRPTVLTFIALRIVLLKVEINDYDHTCTYLTLRHFPVQLHVEDLIIIFAFETCFLLLLVWIFTKHYLHWGLIISAEVQSFGRGAFPDELISRMTGRSSLPTWIHGNWNCLGVELNDVKRHMVVYKILL